MYVSFSSGDSAEALNCLQSCFASIQSWMSTNKLKLNQNKTEFLLRNERQQRKYHSLFPIELVRVNNNPAKSYRNLGVLFDHKFTFQSHIPAVCSSCFYHIRDLCHIRCSIDLHSAKLLSTAPVSSRLDYCNPLLYGIADTDPNETPTRFQRVKNQLTCILTKLTPLTCSVSLLHLINQSIKLL